MTQAITDEAVKRVKEQLDLRAQGVDVLAATILELRRKIAILETDDKKLRAAILEKAQELFEEEKICFDGTQEFLDEHDLGSLVRTGTYTFKMTLEVRVDDTSQQEAEDAIKEKWRRNPWYLWTVPSNDLSAVLSDLEYVEVEYDD